MFGGVPRRAWCCVVQQKVQFRLQFGDRANPSPSERVSLLFASTMMAMSIPWLSLCLASVLQSMWLGYFCNPSDHCETLTWLARWILYWFVRFDEFVWICRRAQPSAFCWTGNGNQYLLASSNNITNSEKIVKMKASYKIHLSSQSHNDL